MVHKTKDELCCRICKKPYDNAKAKEFVVVDGVIACLKHKGVKELVEKNKEQK